MDDSVVYSWKVAMTPVPDHPISRRTLLRAAGAAGLTTTGVAALGTGSAWASAAPPAGHPVAADDGARVVAEESLDPRMVDLTIESPAMAAQKKVRLLLPPDWDNRPYARWPVLYLLHGCCDTYVSWTRSTDVEALTANTDVLVVMPDAGTNGYYSDWWNGGDGGPPRWETFHLVELRQILERGYRAGHRRAVAGLSMGGLGAMYYAARSHLFKGAASFSGAVDPLRDPGSFSSLPPQAWGDRVAQRDIWIAHDPYYLAVGLRGVKNFIACGDGQPGPFDPPGTGFNSLEYSREQMSLALAGRLSELHIPATTEFYGPGTHSWPYWQRDLHHAFPMLMSAIGAHPSGSA